MVRKYHLVGVAAAVLASVAVARVGWGGEVTGLEQVEFQGDTTLTLTDPTSVTDLHVEDGHHWVTWSIDQGVGALTITDYAPADDLTGDVHTYYQTIDGDPLSMITTYEYNFTGVPWIGLDISISTDVPNLEVAFVSSPMPSSSPAWTDTPVVTSDTIHFSGTPSLAPGDMTTLTYEILITPLEEFTGPSIHYCITETPILEGGGGIPEPGSLALLALGGLGLVMRRRR